MDVSELIKIIGKGENERVEFKEKLTPDLGKEVCAMANSLGGFIIIGVDDNGNVKGVYEKNVELKISNYISSIFPRPKTKIEKIKIGDKEVVVLEVERSKNLCSIGGQVFIRIGTTKRPLELFEILSVVGERGNVYFDEEVTNVEYKKEKTEEEFFKKIKKHVEERIKYLIARKMIKRRKNKYFLTNAGILTLKENPEKYIPEALVKIVKLDGKKEMVEEKEIKGPIWKVAEESYYYIKDEIGEVEIFVGLERKKIPKIPERALREAIINALIHKNYLIPGEVLIFLEKNKIRIKNPGGVIPGVDLNDPIHLPRNPHLCEIMKDLGLVEKYGIGIQMIRKLCKEHPLTKVEFKTKAFSFEVIFTFDYYTILDNIDKKIIKILEEKELSSSEIAKQIGLTKQTTVRRLNKLISMGIITKKGKGNKTRYVCK